MQDKPLTMEELAKLSKQLSSLESDPQCVRIKDYFNSTYFNVKTMRRLLAAAERSIRRPIATAPWPIKWPETPGLWVEFHGPLGGYNVSFWDQEKIDDYKRLEIPPRNQFYGPIPIPGEGGV